MNLQLLREHIINQYVKDKAPEGFNDDYNLIDEGILDSLAIMNLIAWLEKQYAIEFDEGDIVLENFNSVNALVDFVQKKSAASADR
ncbi:acyl carrier protein [Candidatus Methylobacter oryzae]|uniref:Acyl carrier protein n=1 Tax=Candidatus Methylobacter oryzae TaxID=2497749 RepID=A0ABY3C6B8_9GAMM|nr:acyl carrier protein [Candidatus Methylobacter oryzae]TRW90813.1 acyl carrier protein [Candidatus Methylobacter oryzae]